MKICPKCGQEFEGDNCPRCTGPEIIVNNNEYLQRKKAYEEKQAKLESASSSSSQTINNPENIDEIFARIRRNSSTAVKNIQKKSKKSAQNKNDNEDIENSKAKLKTRKKTANKQLRFIVALAAVMIIVTAAGYGIYKLVTRKNFTLYMSYNDKIYDVASLDTSYVCDMSDAVFASDKKTFFKADWPESIDKNKISESCVSKNGKYFAAVTYNTDNNTYLVCVWSEDGCVEVCADKNQKNIKTITDDGILIYTDTEVVNQQGYIGSTTLYAYTTFIDKAKETGNQLSGTSIKIESNLASACVYSENDYVVCYNTANKLYTYNYKNNEKSSVISSVNAIYPMAVDTPYYYVAQTLNENMLSEADSLVYLADGNYYYIDFDDGKTFTIGKENGTNMSFIYEKKNACVYIISSGLIKKKEIKNETAGQTEEICKLGNKQNLIYESSSKKIFCINDSSELIMLENGKMKTLRKDVLDGSLSKVGNTQEGITYISDDTQYYKDNASASETAIYSEDGLKKTSDTYLYKEHIYFYNVNKELFNCTKKGKELNKIGQVDSLWLGTEWK